MTQGGKDHAAIVAELERRIDELEHLDEAEFGHFTAIDWVLCIGGALIVPYAVYLWFWR